MSEVMPTVPAPCAQPLRPSQLVRLMAAHSDCELTVGHMMSLLGDRAIVAAILVFAVPVLLPLPPGAHFLFGLPLIFISAQLMLGRRAMWLPGFVTGRRLRLSKLRRPLASTADKLAWAEGRLKQRHRLLCTRGAERLAGAACLILSLVIFLPIPLASLMPALALTVFALGLLRQDGLVVAWGWLCCIFALSYTQFLTSTLAAGATPLMRGLLG